MTDMKFLPDTELKEFATSPGLKQYLAFDELARRVRDNPSDWGQQEEPLIWNPFDITRAPNAFEAEWAYLKLSQQLNNAENYDLIREQNGRLDELERHLDQDPESLEIKYMNAIVDKLRRSNHRT